jgi:hypothetical protein
LPRTSCRMCGSVDEHLDITKHLMYAQASNQGDCRNCNEIAIDNILKYLNPREWFNGVGSTSETLVMVFEVSTRRCVRACATDTDCHLCGHRARYHHYSTQVCVAVGQLVVLHGRQARRRHRLNSHPISNKHKTVTVWLCCLSPSVPLNMRCPS